MSYRDVKRWAEGWPLSWLCIVVYFSWAVLFCALCVCVCVSFFGGLALIPISCEMCVYTPCAKRNNIKTLLLFFLSKYIFDFSGLSPKRRRRRKKEDRRRNEMKQKQIKSYLNFRPTKIFTRRAQDTKKIKTPSLITTFVHWSTLTMDTYPNKCWWFSFQILNYSFNKKRNNLLLAW